MYRMFGDSEFHTSQMLQTHEHVVSTVRQTYAIEEVNAEVFTEYTCFCTDFTVKKEASHRMLWTVFLLCRTVLFDMLLKSLFIDGLLLERGHKPVIYSSLDPLSECYTAF